MTSIHCLHSINTSIRCHASVKTLTAPHPPMYSIKCCRYIMSTAAYFKFSELVCPSVPLSLSLSHCHSPSCSLTFFSLAHSHFLLSLSLSSLFPPFYFLILNFTLSVSSVIISQSELVINADLNELMSLGINVLQVDCYCRPYGIPGIRWLFGISPPLSVAPYVLMVLLELLEYFTLVLTWWLKNP